jgi:phage gp16-like protein
MPVRQLLAKIHIAKKELGLPDETYRDVLNSLFKVHSSRFLSNDQALKLIRYFKDKGWVPKSKPKKYDDQKGDIYSATPAQKRKIEALWHDLYRGNSETKHLRQFIFNHFKVSDVRFLDKRLAYDVIEALKQMARRRYGESPHAEMRREENATI